MTRPEVLSATPRLPGKGEAGRLRRRGRLPAILYGHGEQAVPIELDAKAAQAALGHRILSLDLSGGIQSAIVKELQHDPVTGEIIHVDLLRVALTERVRTDVEVSVQGEEALKRRGLVLTHTLRSVTLEGPASSLPERLVADVSALGPGEQVLVKDLPLPPGVLALTAPEEGVLSVGTPAAEAAEAAAEAPAGDSK